MTVTLSVAAFALGTPSAIIGIGWLSKLLGWSPEVSRKIVHCTLGLVALSFPLVFDSPGPVWVLAGIVTISLLLLRILPGRENLTHALYRVGRESIGELCYPLAIAIVFTLSQGTPVFYLCAVLVLALADATGAVIGVRYGFNRYWTDEGAKSIEGSFAVALTTFFSIHVPLLVSQTTGGTESLLVACIIAILVMGMEGVSFRGLDNLFLPVFTWILLSYNASLPVDELTGYAIVLLSILALGLVWRSLTRTSATEMLGGVMIIYLAWVGGRWFWVFPLLAFWVVYAFHLRRRSVYMKTHRLGRLISLSGPGLVWMTVMWGYSGDFLVSLLLALAIQSGLVSGAMAKKHERMRVRFVHGSIVSVLMLGLFAGMVLAVSLPGLWVWLGWGALAAVAANAVFCFWQYRWPLPGGDNRLILRHFVIALLFSSVDLLAAAC